MLLQVVFLARVLISSLAARSRDLLVFCYKGLLLLTLSILEVIVELSTI
jgi:hypothetical protein